MKKAMLFLLALGVIAVLAFAQSKSQSNPQVQPGSGMTMMMMNCPMMSKAPGRQMGGGDMRQGMMAMFGLSLDEVSSVLTAKKDVLGLTDAQVKEIATSIASLQQQKLETGMQKMMGQMMAGAMKCPCMQGDSK